MKIVQAWPPNIDAIKERFPDIHKAVLFAYGDTIYSPSGQIIPDYLIAHEETHQRQQEAMGGPEVWWDKYLTDNTFLLSQEIGAYHEQYEFYCARETDRKLRYQMLMNCATALSGPVYGRSIGKAHALFRIKIGK